MVEYTEGQQIIIKIMAKSGLTHLFLYHLLWLLLKQLRSCNGDLTLWSQKYYLALYRKSLLTSDIK